MPEASKIESHSYGPVLNVPALKKFLLRELEMNRLLAVKNRRRRVPCVWGAPGIGKTDLIKGLAKEGYVVKSVPLAQFEEMGDLNGIPQEYQDEKTAEWMTKTCPPEWAPNLKRDGPKVILLLDDFNRADPRILKGTMQLIQEYGLVSWKVDQPDWHMICTANPEGGINDVTPLDPAQVSRFVHVTLQIGEEEGARAWAEWAEENGIDDRAIAFILQNSKVLFGGDDRRNPRTWTQAFDILNLIGGGRGGHATSEADASKISQHVAACVDKDAAASFFVFITKGILEQIDPEVLLDDYDVSFKKLKTLSERNRADCLFAIFERLYLYLKSDRFLMKPKDDVTQAVINRRCESFVKLMSDQELGGLDMRWAIIRRLFHSDSAETCAKTREVIKNVRATNVPAANKLTSMLADLVKGT